jgi:hypothetical protein
MNRNGLINSRTPLHRMPPFSASSKDKTSVKRDKNSGSILLSSLVHWIKNLCQTLHVYVCHFRRRLSPEEQNWIGIMMVWYQDSGQTIEESFPQHESIDGFEEWLHYRERAEVADEQVKYDIRKLVYLTATRSTIPNRHASCLTSIPLFICCQLFPFPHLPSSFSSPGFTYSFEEEVSESNSTTSLPNCFPLSIS